MTTGVNRLEEHFQLWRKEITESNRSDRSAASQAVARLYSLIGRDNPTLIYCKSPFQLVMLPSLVVNILNSEPWFLLAAQLQAASSDDHALEQAWEASWVEVWENIASPLLHQMLRNVRHADEFLHLLPPLRDSLKEQLFQRLKSGKFDLTELKLHRNAYRQAWLVQEWIQSETNAAFEKMLGDLSACLHGRIDGNSYAEDGVRYEQALLDFATYVLRLEEAITLIIFRMGAEGVSQTSSAIWKNKVARCISPFGLPVRNPEVDEPQIDERKHEIAAWRDVIRRTSAIMALEDLCFVCELPTRLAVNDRGDLHNPNGPALAYADGFQLHAWNGVIVPADIIDFPEVLGIDRIDSERNAEVRRAMIEIYGQARYVQESGAQVMHQDDFGILYRKDMKGDEPLVMVKVVNSTAEPDGTFKDYFLRVPPTVSTAKEAVAWTFSLSEEDYFPDRQT